MRSLEFDSSAFEDLTWWIEQDRAQALRIVRLVREVQREPFSGLGKPEPLKHELSGCWSRRINQEHRLVYQVLPDKIRIPAATFEYRLGSRSTLEWVIDQYQVKGESDPNREDDPGYIVRLVGRVVRVSVATVQIVEGLPDYR